MEFSAPLLREQKIMSQILEDLGRHLLFKETHSFLYRNMKKNQSIDYPFLIPPEELAALVIGEQNRWRNANDIVPSGKMESKYNQIHT